MTVLNPDEMTQWPDPTIDFNNKQLLQTLPKGLRIRFSIDNVEYEWIFSLLNTDFLKKLNPADSESSTSTPKTDS